MRIIRFLIIFLVIFFASCSRAPAEETSQNTPATSTVQATRTPKPSPPLVRTPELTPQKTATLPLTTSTPTQTSTVTKVPPIVPETLMAEQAIIIETVKEKSKPRILATYPSPVSSDQTEITIYDCVDIDGGETYSIEQLNLIRGENGSEKTIIEELIYCGGLGAFGLEGLSWSPNGAFFYYDTAREGAPDGLCGYWDKSIYRLDATEGTVEYLGDGPFSPDGKKLAAWKERFLTLYNLNLKEPLASLENLYEYKNYALGPIAWSPDSQAVVYLQTEKECIPFGYTEIVRVSLKQLKNIPFLMTEQGFARVIWDTPNRIRLFTADGEEWRYNFETREYYKVGG